MLQDYRYFFQVLTGIVMVMLWSDIDRKVWERLNGRRTSWLGQMSDVWVECDRWGRDWIWPKRMLSRLRASVICRTSFEVMSLIVEKSPGWWYLYWWFEKTRTSSRRPDRENREIIILASIYCNQGYTTLAFHGTQSIPTDHASSPANKPVMSPRETPLLARKFPFDQYDQHPAAG